MESMVIHMNKDFWTSKKVLVTGSNAFIGSWLTETLVREGANVTAFVKENEIIGTESIDHLKPGIRIIKGDILNREDIKKSIEGNEIVFHLAAITQVLYSIKNPVETVNVNVNGTLNLLEEMRKNKGDQFLIFASTDKVYGEPKYNPIDEDHTLSSKSPYDASKLAADRLVNSYNISYGVKSSIVRWSNTYGGRDSNILRTVPDFITSLINNRPPVIRGDGKNVRDYMHVSDAVNGILTVAEKYKVSNAQSFNLGTGKPTSLKDLAELIIKLFGKKEKMKPVIRGKKTSGEINIQYLSSKKAKRILQWQSEIKLKKGLIDTIDWYKKNTEWQKVMKRSEQFYKKQMII